MYSRGMCWGVALLFGVDVVALLVLAYPLKETLHKAVFDFLVAIHNTFLNLLVAIHNGLTYFAGFQFVLCHSFSLLVYCYLIFTVQRCGVILA